jgi:hypothetical protein
MATPNTVDRQAQLIRLILVILGAILAVVGWYRWASAATLSAGQQNASARAAVPVDPITAIVDASRHPRRQAGSDGAHSARAVAHAPHRRSVRRRHRHRR